MQCLPHLVVGVGLSLDIYNRDWSSLDRNFLLWVSGLSLLPLGNHYIFPCFCIFGFPYKYIRPEFRMDVFDYRSSRVIAKDGIFEIGDAPVSDISGMFMRLKNLMVSEIHTQWDILFLAQYVTDSMVPRSLRWEVSPQKGETDFQDWFQFFNEAGGKLL